MREEEIAEVGIDKERRVFVRPASGDFEQIYRTATGVYWDRATRRLSHPVPREWTPVRWFRQILADIAYEYRVRLELTDRTVWTDVSVDLRSKFEARSETS